MAIRDQYGELNIAHGAVRRKVWKENSWLKMVDLTFYKDERLRTYPL